MVKMRARFSFQIQRRIEPMKSCLGVSELASPMMLLGLLVIALQACSSSGSDSSAGTFFSDPVDASTLRSALITGSFAGDDAEYWKCTVSDGSAVYEYRLMADGTGVENDLANPTVPSTFTWETDSAATLTTLVDASGMQNDLSSIVFTDRNNMSLIVAQSVSLACVRQGGEGLLNPVEPATPADDNTLSYASSAYGLTYGFERVYSGYLSSGRSHSEHEFCVADASFSAHYNTDIGLGSGGVSWYPDDESVLFCASLFVPVETNFESASFNFSMDSVDEQNNPQFVGRYFFNKATLEIDSSRNGTISNDENEYLNVTSGSISVTRLSGDVAKMLFDVILDDGAAVSGSFEGSFTLYDDSI